MSDAIRLVELEERLWQDADGSLKRGLLAGLHDALAGIRARLAKGGSQDDYAHWAAEEDAVCAAIEVLEQVELAPPVRAPAGPALSMKGET